VNALQEYLDVIVEPTFEDFKRNPHSMRHAYLACVAVYHAIDRAAYPKRPGNLRNKWRKESFQFVIVDMVAHKFKHVISDDEKSDALVQARTRGIPIASMVFGSGNMSQDPTNARSLAEGGIALHNLYFVISDAIKFLWEKAASLP
jgi:hypothetical protein